MTLSAVIPFCPPVRLYSVLLRVCNIGAGFMCPPVHGVRAQRLPLNAGLFSSSLVSFRTATGVAMQHVLCPRASLLMHGLIHVPFLLCFLSSLLAYVHTYVAYAHSCGLSHILPFFIIGMCVCRACVHSPLV